MTCCIATSSAVFDGCRQVVCACLKRSQGGVYPSSLRGPQLNRAVRRFSIFRGQARPLAGDLREHRELHSTFSKFWFATLQCRTCAMELRWDLSSSCRSITHPNSTHCFAGSCVCHNAGRLVSLVDCSVIQCSRYARSAEFIKLFQRFYASVELRRSADGET